MMEQRFLSMPTGYYISIQQLRSILSGTRSAAIPGFQQHLASKELVGPNK
jgi:hypothetical protein